jgi:hypothetical protein
VALKGREFVGRLAGCDHDGLRLHGAAIKCQLNIPGSCAEPADVRALEAHCPTAHSRPGHANARFERLEAECGAMYQGTVHTAIHGARRGTTRQPRPGDAGRTSGGHFAFELAQG